MKGDFETFLGNKRIALPTPTIFEEFMDVQAHVYHGHQPKQKQIPISTRVHATLDTKQYADRKACCYICKGDHAVAQCDQFLASNDRVSLLRNYKICIYCAKHKFNFQSPCRARESLKCNICKEKHITLLHPDKVNDVKVSFVNLTQNDEASILLPTAIATVMDKNDNPTSIRCLIDQCAHRSYVSEDLVQKLGLKKMYTNVTFEGVNGVQGKVKSKVNLKIKLCDNRIIDTYALVVPRVTHALPAAKIKVDLSSIKRKLSSKADQTLADPTFFIPGGIQALLGGIIVSSFFKEEANCITDEGLLLQPTHFGWLVSGQSLNNNRTNVISTFVTTTEDFLKGKRDSENAEKIMEFYEFPIKDDIENKEPLEEEYCEKLFQVTQEPRMVVKLFQCLGLLMHQLLVTHIEKQ